MKIDELQALTDQPFDYIATAANGEIIFAVPIPGHPELKYTRTEGDGIELEGTLENLGPWEDAWDEYVATLTNGPKYRTKKIAEAGGAIVKMPDNLALPTIKPYYTAISTIESSPGHLQPVVKELADKLMFENGKLYFEGHEAQGVELIQYYDRRPQAVSDLDLPMLRAIYSVILQDVSEMLQDENTITEKLADPQYLGHSVKLYLSEFMHMMGYEKNGSRENEKLTVKKITEFNNVIGVMETSLGGRKRQSLYPVMLFMGYNVEDGTVRFASPYINKLIMDIAKASIQKNEKGETKFRRSGKPFMLPSYTYLVKASIAKEKNKRAAEIVCIVATLIEQAGDNTPHIRAQTIVDRCPDLKYALEATERSSNKTLLLRRAFEKAWELLHTQTRLEEVYKNIQLPTKIPTAGTLDMVFEFPHEGKKSD